MQVLIKTITETDVYLWAAVSQDSSPMHTSEEFAANGPAGTRIAHGNLVAALMAETARRWHADAEEPLGASTFHKLRYVLPVRLGDTITIRYDRRPGQNPATPTDMTVTNQDADVVAAGSHAPCVLGELAVAGGGRRGGSTVSFSRTVSASDVAIHRFLMGDRSALNALRDDGDERDAPCAAPPDFMTGLLSAASALWCMVNDRADSYSYGYDDLALGAEVRAGDTLTLNYTTDRARPVDHKIVSRVSVSRDGEPVAAARHILWCPDDEG